MAAAVGMPDSVSRLWAWQDAERMDETLHAVVMLPDGTTTTHPLPARGAVAIGRADECDITIADASISITPRMRHA